MSVLTTHNLSVGFTSGKTTTTLMSGLNLNFGQGSLVALLGQNGAGKSTLLRAITRATSPVEGEILIDGKNIDAISQRALSRLIGLVSTDRVSAGALTVNELVSLGRQPHTGFLGRLDDGDRKIVADAIADVGITAKAGSYIAQLSDGERQKAMIAKALAQETPVIILDEPTAFLDVASRVEIMRLLHSLAHDRNKAVLLSSHDISQSLLLADELWLITRERRLIAGATEEVVMSGAMNSVFDSTAISFNSSLCDYEPRLATTASVRLVCDDAVLRRCVANALLRNGIAVSDDAPRAVTAASLRDFELSDGTRCGSVAALVDALK